MVKWIQDIFAQKKRPYRRPTVKLGVERLEDRTVPSTLWTDGFGSHSASDGRNWSNGVPTGSSAAVFDPTQLHGSMDTVTWDKSITCQGIVVQNGWNSSFYINSGVTVSTNANFSIGGKSSVNLYANNSPMTLETGAQVTVASGCLLQLYNGGLTSGVTFFQGDQNPGEIVSNSGTTVYYGSASNNGVRIQDYIKVPVLNTGIFDLYGGNNGPQGQMQPNAGGNPVGSQLNVSGSDPLTNSVSWYQKGSTAATELRWNVWLSLQKGYTQDSGFLNTDNWTETLEAKSSSGYGTVSINSGKVQVNQADAVPYGSLNILALTVNLGAEIDEHVAGTLASGDSLPRNSLSSLRRADW